MHSPIVVMLGLNVPGADQHLSSRENFEKIYAHLPENFYLVLAVPIQPYRMNQRLTIQQGLFFCGNNPLMGFSRCLKRLLDHAKERHGGKWVHKLVVEPEARLIALRSSQVWTVSRNQLRIKTEIFDFRDWREPPA